MLRLLPSTLQSRLMDVQAEQSARDRKELDMLNATLIATARELRALQQDNSDKQCLLDASSQRLQAMQSRMNVVPEERAELASKTSGR